MTRNNVGLDSQCYTYIINTMSNLNVPTGDLSNQYIALFRTLLYREGGLFISPTVRKEFEAIPSTEKTKFHKDWTTLFPEIQPINQQRIDDRSKEFSNYHKDCGDCRILAEAEDASLNTLLTFDTDFIKHLAKHTCISLHRPEDYWNSLAIPKGARPFTTPRADNPMSQETWWRW